MAAPRNIDHSVGGLYRMTGDDEDSGGDEADSSSPAEYCSLSECIVMPLSASRLDESCWDDIGLVNESGFGIWLPPQNFRQKIALGTIDGDGLSPRRFLRGIGPR